MPLNRLETFFDQPLRKKKDRLYFLYHICGLDVHCFCPPREKNDDIHYFFVMMRNCSHKFNNYKAVSRKDWKKSNRIIWLARIYVDRDLTYQGDSSEKKKLFNNFQNFSLNVPYQWPFEKYKKKGRSPRLFERNDGPNSPHLCLY